MMNKLKLRILLLVALFKNTWIKAQTKAYSTAFGRFLISKRGASYGGVAGTIIAIALALYVAAYTLPDAFVALTCSTSWTGAPTAVTTLGTTVLAIVVIVGIMIKFMPSEIKSRVGF